jgi:hypothetical protein
MGVVLRKLGLFLVSTAVVGGATVGLAPVASAAEVAAVPVAAAVNRPGPGCRPALEADLRSQNHRARSRGNANSCRLDRDFVIEEIDGFIPATVMIGCLWVPRTVPRPLTTGIAVSGPTSRSSTAATKA